MKKWQDDLQQYNWVLNDFEVGKYRLALFLYRAFCVAHTKLFMSRVIGRNYQNIKMWQGMLTVQEITKRTGQIISRY